MQTSWDSLLCHPDNIALLVTTLRYMVDQRNILFWKNALNCNNKVVRTIAMSMINWCSIGVILSKYCIPSVNMKVCVLKSLMWKHFADSAYNSGKVHFW